MVIQLRPARNSLLPGRASTAVRAADARWGCQSAVEFLASSVASSSSLFRSQQSAVVSSEANWEDTTRELVCPLDPRTFCMRNRFCNSKWGTRDWRGLGIRTLGRIIPPACGWSRVPTINFRPRCRPRPLWKSSARTQSDKWMVKSIHHCDAMTALAEIPPAHCQMTLT